MVRSFIGIGQTDGRTDRIGKTIWRSASIGTLTSDKNEQNGTSVSRNPHAAVSSKLMPNGYCGHSVTERSWRELDHFHQVVSRRGSVVQWL